MREVRCEQDGKRMRLSQAKRGGGGVVAGKNGKRVDYTE